MTIFEMRRRRSLALRLAGLCSHDDPVSGGCVGCRAYDHYMTIRDKYDLRIEGVLMREKLRLIRETLGRREKK